MKVALITVKTNSGNDRYFQILSLALDNLDEKVDSTLFFLPTFIQYLPFLIPFYSKRYRLNRFDIIHTNLEHSYFYKHHKTKIVSVVHHVVFNKIYQRYTNLFQKLFHYLILYPLSFMGLKTSDRIVAVSKNTENDLLNTFNFKISKLRVIYNAIDTSLFLPREQSSKAGGVKLLYVGNLSKRKGVDLLPKILSRLDNRFTLFMTNGLRKNIFLVSNDNIEFLGKISKKQLIDQYNSCDIFIFPSRYEGFGYSVVEAMACGTPIVTTNCSSLPELVEEKKNGFLCQVDNAADFAKKITTLADNDNLRSRIKKQNREKVVKKFSIFRLGEEYYNLFSKI